MNKEFTILNLRTVLARWLAISVISLFLSACASASEYIYHSFSFGLDYDNQDAVILDYWYGNSKHVGVQARAASITAGREYHAQDITQSMVRGDSLFVKWRNTNTGKVYEDTVDLRQRLPAAITNHTIYLMIKGPQLYVYLISPEPRPLGIPPIGPSMYRSKKIIMIYPD